MNEDTPSETCTIREQIFLLCNNELREQEACAQWFRSVQKLAKILKLLVSFSQKKKV